MNKQALGICNNITAVHLHKIRFHIICVFRLQEAPQPAYFYSVVYHMVKVY